MKILSYYTDDRPLLFKKRIYHTKGCYIDKNVRRIKDAEFTLTSTYVNDNLLSTLIYAKKAGAWVKSKLKYYKDGKLYKSIYSEAK